MCHSVCVCACVCVLGVTVLRVALTAALTVRVVPWPAMATIARSGRHHTVARAVVCARALGQARDVHAGAACLNVLHSLDSARATLAAHGRVALCHVRQ